MICNTFPVSLLNWIDCASTSNISEKQYLESAVDLALMIIRRIIQNQAHEDEILADNVIVHVSDSSTACSNSQILSVDIEIKNDVPTGLVDHRKACHALGKLFLLLFSKRKSQSSWILEGAHFQRPEIGKIALGGNSTNDIKLLGIEEGESLSLTEKRINRSNEVSTRKSTKRTVSASSFLRDLGLPVSVCRLVSDLLEADNDELRSDMAFSFLEEVEAEMLQLSEHKNQFLYDRTCPTRALEDTTLFQIGGDDALFGRELELDTLLNALDRVASESNNTQQHNIYSGITKLPREAVFISGHSGSGKSSLMKKVTHRCRESDWFVVDCKFDEQMDPLMTILNGIDASIEGFFEKSWPHTLSAGKVMSESILTSIDREGINQLCILVPNLSRFFPDVANPKDLVGQSFGNGVIGAGRNRLDYLFHVLIKSICLGSKLVLSLDDLQWADTLTVTIVLNFMSTIDQTLISPNISFLGGKGGLLLLGSYRENEVEDDGCLMNHIRMLSQSLSVSFISTAGLSKSQINDMLSAKLYIPKRLTSSLADVVHKKTCGNPMFVKEFLKSIITNRMLQFSVKSRRWVWDEDTLDLISITDGVAELLSVKLRILPSSLLQVLKIVAALGSQVDVRTFKILDQDQLGFQLHWAHSLSIAVQEGLMEKAGSVYSFTHDSLRSAVYNLIPPVEQKLLHKKIGTSMMKKVGVLDPANVLIAADQMNLCHNYVTLSPHERINIARLQLLAGKHSMSTSSFEAARLYFESGVSLLGNDDWHSNYSLTLELYEMSALVEFINGNENSDSILQKRLESIFRFARRFEDAFNANILQIKLLGSRGNYSNAIRKCLDVLSQLGESFPEQIDWTLAESCVAELKNITATLTKDHICQYPKMTDQSKLTAMKFMNLITLYAVAHKPMLMPIVSNRMLKLSLQFGFCDDSLLGLSMAGYSIVNFGSDISTGYRVSKLAEALIELNPVRQALKTRLVTIWYGHSKPYVEPIQSAREIFVDLYNQCMLVGDVENAMYSWLFYCNLGFHIGSNLDNVEKAHSILIEKTRKFKHHTMLSAMSSFRACKILLCPGVYENDTEIADIKTFEEIRTIAHDSNNEHLLWHVDLDEMQVRFWFREYIPIAKLSEKYRNSKSKRSFELLRKFYDGISSFSFARDTGEEFWAQIGEECVTFWTTIVSLSNWNFENNLLLLQAESSYTKGDFADAETLYEASILSARRHKFLHEEALACELFGIYYCDRGMAEKGWDKLQLALQKYSEWGALGKAASLEKFMSWVNPEHFKKLKMME